MDDLNRKPKEGCGFVYCYTFNNGKKYIGQTIRSVYQRIKDHRSKKMPVDKAIQSGLEFKAEILAEVPYDLMDSVERFCIGYFRTMHPSGYNMTSGGQANKFYSEEARRKISMAQKGKKRGPRPADYVHPKYWLGKKRPAKDVENMRKRMKEHFSNEDARRKLSETMKQYYIDHPEKKPNKEKECKSVICLETKKVYKSIRDGAQDIGCVQTHISRAIKGKENSVHGLHWMFYSEQVLEDADEILECLLDWERTKQEHGIQLSGFKRKRIEWAIPVRCIETGQVFPSIDEASRRMNLKSTTLHYHLLGVQKSIYGLHFERA